MKDLLTLYKTESVYPHESEISKVIEDMLTKHEAVFESNEFGIVGHSKQYAGNEPLRVLLSAHMDQVKTKGAPTKFYMNSRHEIRGYLDDYTQTSLGADDKNGVWLIIKALQDGLPFQFVISRGEECGGIGIKKLDIPNADICLVLDRREYNHILNKGGSANYCSTLAQCLCNFLGIENWIVRTGTFSDTDTICELMESVNMSVAYYKPHFAEEYTNFRELTHLRCCISRIIQEFRHYPTEPHIYMTKIRGDRNETASLFDRKQYW